MPKCQLLFDLITTSATFSSDQHLTGVVVHEIGETDEKTFGELVATKR
jgi:hypothetical protein